MPGVWPPAANAGRPADRLSSASGRLGLAECRSSSPRSQREDGGNDSSYRFGDNWHMTRGVMNVPRAQGKAPAARATRRGVVLGALLALATLAQLLAPIRPAWAAKAD